MTSPAEVRRIYGGDVTPSGDVAGRFKATSSADRQILADAEAADAGFLVTEDVDDFGETDLLAVGMSAVNPDLFLSVRMTAEAYTFTLGVLARTRSNPRRSVEQIHAGIAQRHPRLFAVYADLFETEPEPGVHAEPAVIFRGARCLRTGQVVEDPAILINGILPEH